MGREGASWAVREKNSAGPMHAVARREGSWAPERMWASRRESSAELQLGPIGRKREGERKEAMGLKREGGFFLLFFYCIAISKPFKSKILIHFDFESKPLTQTNHMQRHECITNVSTPYDKFYLMKNYYFHMFS